MSRWFAMRTDANSETRHGTTVPAPLRSRIGLAAAVWLAAMAVAVLQASLFLAGYRLAADDVELHYIVLQGLDSVARFTAVIAREHGRIGNHVMLPVNAIGTYFADYLLFRVFAVGLHFWTMYLAASFVSAMLSRNVTAILFLLLVILHPLEFEHLPPNAYAIQNSVPIVLLILSRLWLWRLREADTAPKLSRLIPGYGVFCFAMLINEYATILGAVLLMAEHVTLICRRYVRCGSIGGAIAGAFRSLRLWADAVAFAACFAIYFSFRLLNPSVYQGNNPDGLDRFHETWTTVYMHIVSGTVYPRLMDTLSAGYLAHTPDSVLATGSIVAVLTFFVFAAAAKPDYRSGAFLITVLVCTLAAIAITLPVALTSRFQNECVSGSSCTYLDVRLSLYTVGTVLTAALLTGYSALGGRMARRVATVAMAMVLAVLSLLTYLTNWHTRQNMKLFVSGWERATAIACVPALWSMDKSALAGLIEPVKRISHHPGFPMEDYWQAYVEDRSRHLDCDRLPDRIERLTFEFDEPYLSPGRIMDFSDPRRAGNLVSGWSGQEEWGVWSIGKTAEIELGIPSPDVQALGFRFWVYPPPELGRPPQLIEVSLNGVPVADWTLGQQDCGGRVLALDEPLPSDVPSRVTFTIAAPVVPRDLGASGDVRRLGIGLIEMMAAGPGDPDLGAWAEREC